jgi:imidazole glycerol-phosphate synthase subunit HisH
MSVSPRSNSAPQIAVVDYDIGNLHSVCKGLEFAGAAPIVTDDPQVMAQADGLLLPGVGAFDPAIRHLRDRDLIEPLRAIAASGKPFLGICLGMQIMVDGSDEGEEPGLGIIPGWVRQFRSEPEIRIPQMGWNTLELTQSDCPLWQQLPREPWMYFVHSYYVEPVDGAVNAAIVTHGSQSVSAALCQGSVMATQFHPEKSSRDGLAVLANFVGYVAARG